MDEDLEIINKVKSGQTEAFSVLVDKYKKPVLNLIYRYMGDAADSEDLAQEAFLRAFKALPSFEARAKFFTWLYRITVNLAIRARKKKSALKFQSIENKMQEGSSEVISAALSTDSPEVETERNELKRQVQLAINALPDDYRMIVILSRYHDLSYEEISEVLNLTLAAVKSRLHRAKKMLKEKLEGYVNRQFSWVK